MNYTYLDYLSPTMSDFTFYTYILITNKVSYEGGKALSTECVNPPPNTSNGMKNFL